MLKDLQDLFRRSWDAFRSEASRREPEDQVAELLSAMRRELGAARAALPEYEAAARHAEADLAGERTALADAERRGALAEKIGDAETVRVARDFVARQRERIAVLEQKAAAARAEHQLRRREAEEMLRTYQEADANRWGLVAQLRSRRAQARIDGGAEPLWGEMDRMEDALRDRAAYADALEELSDIDAPPRPAPGPSPAEVERRLEELKRRMGRE